MDERTCTAGGCPKAQYARGWCKNHYMQWWRRPESRSQVAVVKRPECCVVDGCVKPVKSTGLCPGHWQRNSRYGSPTGQPPRETADERFWRRVIQGPGDCWLWDGPSTKGGYGKFPVDGRDALAHRWAYEAMVGPIPAGLQLDHLCFMTACVNPYHLDPVTASVNLDRRDAHQRAS